MTTQSPLPAPAPMTEKQYTSLVKGRIEFWTRLARVHNGLSIRYAQKGDPKGYHYHRGCKDMAMFAAWDCQDML